MNRFINQLELAYPVMELRDAITPKGVVRHYADIKNAFLLEENPSLVPYIEDANVYIKGASDEMPRRMLLVTENKLVALKAACYINDHHPESRSKREDALFFFEDLDDEEEDDEDERMMRVVSLKLRKPIDQNLVNEYILLMDGIDRDSSVFFMGLSGMTESNEKIEAIGVCPAKTQYLWIHPNQMKMPWIQKLLIDLQFDVVRIRNPRSEYYETVLHYLMKDGPYVLADEISSSMLVRKIQKRRGADFKEEDLAWYLDRAAEHAAKHHPESSVLEMDDFKNLSLGEKKPMERLEELIGIPQVKGIVAEVAAVVQEEMHNEKLGTLHKNMLFLGNPGTGKTTCSELLADIMAEEGDTNAVFISAARRDLIGEYVGHTAPKVAKKFEEARGGVLFIDEAGFLTHQNTGGYVEEAVKEFVRYMELYPDVTVIFAMYPHEAKTFLQLDAGLTSRIGRIVEFEDYTNEELGMIAEEMLEKKGYQMTPEAGTALEECMETLRKEQKKSFGNAREVRRLIESAIIAVSMHHHKKKEYDFCITESIIRDGWKRLEQKTVQSNNVFGFKTGGEKYVNQSYGL